MRGHRSQDDSINDAVRAIDIIIDNAMRYYPNDPERQSEVIRKAIRELTRER